MVVTTGLRVACPTTPTLLCQTSWVSTTSTSTTHLASKKSLCAQAICANGWTSTTSTLPIPLTAIIANATIAPATTNVGAAAKTAKRAPATMPATKTARAAAQLMSANATTIAIAAAKTAKRAPAMKIAAQTAPASATTSTKRVFLTRVTHLVRTATPTTCITHRARGLSCVILLLAFSLIAIARGVRSRTICPGA